MRRGFGVILVVISVLLFVKANDVGNSFGSQIKRSLTGAPVDVAMHLNLVAVVAGLLGLLLIFWKKR